MREKVWNEDHFDRRRTPSRLTPKDGSDALDEPRSR
jgi:hypothetical protein